MYELVELNKNNINQFKGLNALKDEFNKSNKDFFEIYYKQNCFQQFLQKKKVRLLKKNSTYMGYIWCENFRKYIYRIQALNIIDNKHLLEGYKTLIKSINNYSKIYYECEKNKYNFQLLEELGFYKINGIIEMTLVLDKCIEFTVEKGISFKQLIKGIDEPLRCTLQNRIFKHKDRIPLDIDDIYYDEIQSYYYDDGAIFMKKDNDYIGYGQIIIKAGDPYIVNFGLLNNWRNKGYGKIFMCYLLKILYDKDFKIVKIKVEPNNFNAIKLYKDFGFTEERELYTWVLQNSKN
ncbi:GNAT family N-acetyltransferase [Clostridium sp. ZS2-4]|uniref:GNAT family N-acetyltransferase n=1 Tax=Clostridium sp. ZS2-4 TaxID=2987703 RepID=UPI00227C820D|nr:GNAT family N-acetyltransferase [Clostridium sp. ZS2-4]MCY6356667.1 GNAT family N-acetyltransferase [Clostridium sp. ZS2-4]